MNFSRRTLIRSTLAAPALLRGQSPNEQVRVAVIGTGTRGSHMLNQIMKVPGVKVVAICDLDAGRVARALARVAEAGGQAEGYAEFRALLDRKDIDAVLIATPVDTHKMIAVAALETGKNVYCEKPMATTPEDSFQIVQAAKSARGIFQAGFQLRHDPNRRAAIEFVHSGGIGEVLFLQAYRHTGDLPRETAWYFDRKRSGDNIVEQACHIIDLMTWSIGQPPLRAFGSGGINLFKDQPPGRTTMDNYTVIYEFPNDVRFEFSHLYFDPPGFSGIKERVYGSKGAIDLATATWIEREKRGPIKLDVAGTQTADYLAVEAFIENARDRRTPLNNAESAHRSTLVAMLGRKAIYEKRIVTWKEIAG